MAGSVISRPGESARCCRWRDRRRPKQLWPYDFVFDHSANGQQLKCLTVTDEFTKEGLAIDVDGRIRFRARHQSAVPAGERTRRYCFVRAPRRRRSRSMAAAIQ